MSKKRIALGIAEVLCFLGLACAADVVNVPAMLILSGVALAISQYFWMVPASQEKKRKHYSWR